MSFCDTLVLHGVKSFGHAYCTRITMSVVEYANFVRGLSLKDRLLNDIPLKRKLHLRCHSPGNDSRQLLSESSSCRAHSHAPFSKVDYFRQWVSWSMRTS